MKYYFITYQGTSISNDMNSSVSTWNQVIKVSPMAFIKKVQEAEEKGSRTYYNFVVINTCEITEKEFNEFDGHF